jgi:hypothetical protein
MTSTPATICLFDYFAFLRRPFCIPNMTIYMSFMVAARDTTSSTASSTRREDLIVTTRCHISCLLSLSIVSFCFCLCHELYRCRTCLAFACHKLYCVFDEMCVILLLYSLPVLEAPYSGRQPNQATVKKCLYSFVNRRIYGPTCPAPHPNIFVGDVSLMNATKYIH